jgi:hypothetical protein
MHAYAASEAQHADKVIWHKRAALCLWAAPLLYFRCVFKSHALVMRFSGFHGAFRTCLCGRHPDKGLEVSLAEKGLPNPFGSMQTVQTMSHTVKH